MRRGLQTQQGQTHRHDTVRVQRPHRRSSRTGEPIHSVRRQAVVIPGVGLLGVGHILLYNIGAGYKGVFSL